MGGADAGTTPRFERVRTLGVGGFGVVYEAIDRSSGSRLALKALHGGDSGALYRLKREFRALADLAHPNLVRMFELVSEGDDWFFTMELVDGVDLIRFLRPEDLGSQALAPTERALRDSASHHGPATPPASPARLPPLDQVGSVFRQLAEGLATLHAKGVIHRDIKPGNVLVSREGRVVILDFGIAADAGAALTQASAGTPVYMAPEQAIEEALTPAADWYAFGVMLFEALTGATPFSGAPMQIITDKQHLDAPRVSALAGPDAPSWLDDLCAALLQREPQARPKEHEILARLGATTDATTHVRPASLPTLGGIERRDFVGRAAELEALRDALLQTRRDALAAVVIRGDSGLGKTALARHFLSGELRRLAPDAVVLEGRCYERESIPFKAFDGVADALSRELRRMPSDAASAVLPLQVDALVRLFPVLLRVEAMGDRPLPRREGDARRERARSFHAFRELLGRLCMRSPVVVFLDDLQWGDADSISLLADLTAEPDPPPLMLVMTERGVDGGPSPVFSALMNAWTSVTDRAPIREIALDRLSTVDCRALVASQLGLPPRSGIVAKLADESGGNAFFLGELIRWALTHEAPDETAKSVRLQEVIRGRVRDMPEAAQRLLSIVCLVGRPIATELALDAADAEGTDRTSAIATLRAARLLRTRPAGSITIVEPSHDRVRETLVDGLEDAARAALHLRIAQSLRAGGDADPELLQVHFDGAGRRAEAAAFAAIAGDRASQAFAFERAARLYARALEENVEEPDRRLSLQRKLAESLAQSGQVVPAADAFRAAAGSAEPNERLELRRRAAEQLLVGGHVDRGVAEMSEILLQFGLRIAPSPRAALVGLLFWRLVLWARGLRYVPTPASSLSPRELTRIDACWSVSVGLGVADNIRAAHIQARYVGLALALGEPWRVCRGLTVDAIFRASQGDTRGARRALAAAAEAAKQSPQASANAFVEIGRGGVAWFIGDWVRSRDSMADSISVFAELPTGTRWEFDNATFICHCALAMTGDFRAMSATLPARLREATERGDLYLATNLRIAESSLWWLAQGEPDRVTENVTAAMRDWSMVTTRVQHWYEAQATASVALYCDDPAKALACLERAWPRLRRAFLLRVELIRAFGAYLRGLARVALAAKGADPGVLREVRADTRALRRLGRPFANALAQALEAGAAAIEGAPAPAADLFDRAADALDRASMRAHAAACRLRAATLRGDANAVRGAHDELAALGIVAPIAFARVVAPIVGGTGEGASGSLPAALRL